MTLTVFLMTRRGHRAGFEEIDMVMVAAELEGGTGLDLGPWRGPPVGWHSG